MELIDFYLRLIRKKKIFFLNLFFTQTEMERGKKINYFSILYMINSIELMEGST